MIWDHVMEYSEKCRLVHGRRWSRYFLCSIGAHIANYMNKGGFRAPFYTMFGGVPDIRLHLFLVAPPGYGKTTFLRWFLEERFGLLYRAIDCMQEGKITEKGLIGGYDDRGTKIVGEAEQHRVGIMGFDEFAHISSAAGQDHSSDLLNTMLDLLDSGRCRYRMGSHAPIEFITHFTLWAGTQSERFDLEAGLARRLVFMDMTPDKETVRLYVEAQRSGLGVAPDIEGIDEIRKDILFLSNNFHAQRIIYSDEYLAFRDKINDHLEMSLLDKFAIGYNTVRRYKYEPELYISMDQDLKEIFIEAINMRMHCLNGVGMGLVLKLLKDGPLSMTQLKNALVRRLSIDYKRTEKLLADLLARSRIKITPTTTPGSKKPTQMVEACVDEEIKQGFMALDTPSLQPAFTLD